jgi:hypothetical protein
MTSLLRATTVTTVCIAIGVVRLAAHSGPPFPIVSDRRAGAYEISIWTDPDTTDDGSPGGQFWVVLGTAAGGVALPQDTHVTVTIRPLDRAGPEQSARASPVEGKIARQYASVLMDHEGRFSVRAAIEGPLGVVAVESTVSATYDLRPPPILLGLYLLPFVLIGALWMKLLLRRRRCGSHPRSHPRSA